MTPTLNQTVYRCYSDADTFEVQAFVISGFSAQEGSPRVYGRRVGDDSEDGEYVLDRNKVYPTPEEAVAVHVAWLEESAESVRTLLATWERRLALAKGWTP